MELSLIGGALCYNPAQLILRTLEVLSMTMNVGIFIYNDVEVLDFAGLFEVFSTASSAGVDMSLHLVSRLDSRDLAI